MPQKKNSYGNESISSLKGAERVRKRPGVIFGSDGLDGCQHSIFEIISNSIDEARAGYGNKIIVTRYADHSVEVEDFARGIPVDYNPKEQRYNWELLYCEMYAGENTTFRGTAMNLPLGLTGWASAQPNTPRSLWMSNAGGMDTGIRFILKREKTSAACIRSRTPARQPAPAPIGNPIWRFLPISTSRCLTIRMC